VVERNPVYDLLERRVAGVRVLVTGRFSDQDLGVACYHAKVGAVELLLMVEGAGDRRRTLENLRRLGAEVLPRLA